MAVRKEDAEVHGDERHNGGDFGDGGMTGDGHQHQDQV
jgi:hypothetical protein